MIEVPSTLRLVPMYGSVQPGFFREHVVAAQSSLPVNLKKSSGVAIVWNVLEYGRVFEGNGESAAAKAALH